MAQTNIGATLPMGTSWSSTISALDAANMRQPLHTMWWVNGPLKVNDTVPVLVFSTNVTGSTHLGLGGSLGTRVCSSSGPNVNSCFPDSSRRRLRIRAYFQL